MEQRKYVINEGDAAGEICEASQDASQDASNEKLDEINAKLDMLMASQGIEYNKEVVE